MMRSLKGKNEIGYFKGALTAALVLVLCACCSLRTYAAYGTQEINDSKARIKENQKKLEELKSKTYAVDARLDELNKLKEDAAAYISGLDAELAEVEKEIERLNEEIVGMEQQIGTVETQLSEAEEDERAQYASMKKRIKFMYEHSNDNLISIIFGAEDFSDIINRAEYIRNVSVYDRQKLDEYVELRNAAKAKKEELESARQVMSQTMSEIEDRKNSIEKLQSDKEKEVAGYESGIASKEAELSEMNKDMAGIRAAIQAEENNIAAIEAEIRRQEEEARKKAEANGEAFTPLTVGDISFTWPCPGASRITSKFGDRESPTEGASTNHKGVDIGASSGTPVVAAAGGTVVLATYSASAGNYIMLSHGGSVYTVYMHLSSMSVSKGDTVSRGDKIGAVGSTGYSTGPHLHFGIRINGSYVDPLGYVSP